MRIKILGDSPTASAIRTVLTAGGFAVVPTDDASAHFTVEIVETHDTNIIFDSVDCELERHILRHVTENTQQDVVVRRSGGQIHSDTQIKILVPVNESQAVEKGVFRGITDTVRAMGMNAGVETPNTDSAAVETRINLSERRLLGQLDGLADRNNHSYQVLKDLVSSNSSSLTSLLTAATKELEEKFRTTQQRFASELLEGLRLTKKSFEESQRTISTELTDLRNEQALLKARISLPWWKKILR